MNNETNTINKRIAAYRKLAGFTQDSAAAALGMKKNTYSRMERVGNPSPEMLVKLSKLYKVTVNTLLLGQEKPEENIFAQHREREIIRLSDYDKPLFERRPELNLTFNEYNCVKVSRTLTLEQRKEIMELINKFQKENNE